MDQLFELDWPLIGDKAFDGGEICVIHWYVDPCFLCAEEDKRLTYASAVPHVSKCGMNSPWRTQYPARMLRKLGGFVLALLPAFKCDSLSLVGALRMMDTAHAVSASRI